MASALGHDDARTRIDAAFTFAAAHIDPQHSEWARLHQIRGLWRLRVRELDGAADDLHDAEARFAKIGPRAVIERAISTGYLAVVEILRHRVGEARKLLAAVVALDAFAPGDMRASYLDEVAAEIALATSDLAGARTALARIEPTIDKSIEARLVAHYHLLAAELARRAGDRDRAATERAAAADVLRRADIIDGAGYQDCAACTR